MNERLNWYQTRNSAGETVNYSTDRASITILTELVQVRDGAFRPARTGWVATLLTVAGDTITTDHNTVEAAKRWVRSRLNSEVQA